MSEKQVTRNSYPSDSTPHSTLSMDLWLKRCAIITNQLVATEQFTKAINRQPEVKQFIRHQIIPFPGRYYAITGVVTATTSPYSPQCRAGPPKHYSPS